MKRLCLLTFLIITISIISGRAQIVITEVDPTGSSNSTYKADWFELTNTGASAVNISGWKMDDNSNSFSLAVALNGVTSIAPHQSVVFVEDTGMTDSTLISNFESAWFGTSVPSGFTIGTYGGSGVGLGSSGDAVNIFNSGGTLIANVSFGSSTQGITFDNSAGLNNTTISQQSVAGVNGAFLSPSGETGSPGVVPEPSTLTLLGFGTLLGLHRLRRNRVC